MKSKKGILALIVLIILLLTLGAAFYSCGDSNNERNQGSAIAPPAVDGILPPDVVYAVADNDFSMVITKNGDLWSWGHGKFGNLGTRTIKNAYQPFKIMEDVKSCSCRMELFLGSQKRRLCI